MREEPVKYYDEYARKANKLYTIVMRIHALLWLGLPFIFGLLPMFLLDFSLDIKMHLPYSKLAYFLAEHQVDTETYMQFLGNHLVLFLIIWFAMGCMTIVYDELFRAYMRKRNAESMHNIFDRN